MAGSEPEIGAILNPYVDFDELYDRLLMGSFGEGVAAMHRLKEAWSRRTGIALFESGLVGVALDQTVTTEI